MDKLPQIPSTLDQLNIDFEINKKKIKQICMYDPNTGSIVNGINLNPKASLGYMPKIPKIMNSCIYCLNEDLIIFPTACRIGIFNIIQNTIKYLQTSYNGFLLSYIACVNHPKRGPLVAFAELPDEEQRYSEVIVESIEPPTKIFKLKHDYIKISGKDRLAIHQIIMPTSSKFTVTLSHLTESQKNYISYFVTTKQKSYCHSEVSLDVIKIDVSELDNNLIIACGPSYLHYYTVIEKEIKEDKTGVVTLSIEKEHNFLDAKFLSESSSLVTITEQNDIFLINKKDIIATYHFEFFSPETILIDSNTLLPIDKEEKSFTNDNIIPNSHHKEKSQINLNGQKSKGSLNANVMAVTKNSIVVGSKYGSNVAILEIVKDSEIRIVKEINLGSSYTDIISISSKVSHFVLATKKHYIVPENISENSEDIINSNFTDFLLFSTSVEHESLSYDKITQFQPMGNTNGIIKKISICKSRKLFVSLGIDQIIRVVDYNKLLKQIVLYQHFNCIAYDVSVNPLGFQFAVGTKEGVEIFVIMEGEAKLNANIEGKATHCIEYSNSGKIIAAGMGNSLVIIDSYTYEIKFRLTGHTEFIKQLIWDSDDSWLISACNAGHIYSWNSKFELYSENLANSRPDRVEEAKQVLSTRIEHQNKVAKINGIQFDDEFDLLITISDDNKLSFISDHGFETHLDIDLYPLIPTSVLLLKQQKFLLIGTNEGTIRSYLWPINRTRKAEFQEFKIHSKPILSLAIAIDSETIFSASEDGSIFESSISFIIGDNEGLSIELIHSQSTNELMKLNLSLDSLTLIPQNLIASKIEEIRNLRYELKEKDENFQLEMQKKDKNHESYISQLKDENMKKIEEEKTKYFELQNEFALEKGRLKKQSEENDFQSEKEYKELEKQYLEKLRRSSSNNEDLVRTLEETKARFKKEVDETILQNKQVVNNMQREHQMKYDELLKKYNDLVREMKKDRMKFDETLEQCEQEYEKELSKMLKENAVRVEEEKRLHLEMQKKNNDARKELDEKNKILMKSEEENRAYREEKERMLIEANKKNEDLIKIQEQLGEREEIIRNKEKAINDLKLSNQHLENFRFVLDHKICSLKDEKTPMEIQIKNLEDQISKMYNEMELEHLNKNKLLLNIDELKAKFHNSKLQLGKKENEVRQEKRRMEGLQFELATLMKDSDVGGWPTTLSKIYNNFFEEKKESGTADPHIWQNDNSSNQKMQEIANLKLREEIVKQKEWTHQKLVKAVQQNEKIMKEKKKCVIQMQKHNTELINECNTLRYENQIVAKRIAALEVKFKELTGISITNSQDLEKKLESMLKQIASKKITSGDQKDTPFVQKMLENAISPRNKSILDYYGKVVVSKEQNKDNQNKDNVEGLLVDLEKNKQALSKQNEEIQKLQLKVNQFLLNPDVTEETTKLPPIHSSNQQLTSSIQIKEENSSEENKSNLLPENSLSSRKSMEKQDLSAIISPPISHLRRDFSQPHIRKRAKK